MCAKNMKPGVPSKMNVSSADGPAAEPHGKVVLRSDRTGDPLPLPTHETKPQSPPLPWPKPDQKTAESPPACLPFKGLH